MQTRARDEPKHRNEVQIREYMEASCSILSGLTPPKPPPIYIYGIQNEYQLSRTLVATSKERPITKHTNEFIKFQPHTTANRNQFNMQLNFPKRTGH